MLKKLTILLTVLIPLISISQNELSINIIEAAKTNSISYKIKGSYNTSSKLEYMNGEGMYFGMCMTINIKSNTDSIINIYIPNGLMLMSEDTLTQNMIITKPIYVDLIPAQNRTIELHAMCSEMHDGPPYSLISYSVGEMADSNLIIITSVINDMFMHNIVGQGAIWSYTDNATKKDLTKYGATDASIELTKAILNKANVFTGMNPVEEEIITASTVESIAPPTPEPNKKDELILNTYLVYSAGGVIIILLFSTLYFAFKRKQNKPKIS